MLVRFIVAKNIVIVFFAIESSIATQTSSPKARLIAEFFYEKDYSRKANISSSVVPLVKLPMYKSSIGGLFMLFLLLTIRVHSESSVWIDFWWSVRGQSARDLFCFCSSFSDIYSSFCVFSLFVLLFICYVLVLGWSWVLVLSKMEGILINDYYKYIHLAASKVLKKVTVFTGHMNFDWVAGLRGLSLKS